MLLDLGLVGKTGLVWGIIGLVLMLVIGLLGAFVPPSFGLEGLSMVGYAAIFAGVHFGLRVEGSWVMALIGGALAGTLAALIIMLVIQFVPLPFMSGTGFTVQGLVGGFVAGLAGGLGIRLAKRF